MENEESVPRIVAEIATAWQAMARARKIALRHDLGESIVDEFERVQDRLDQARHVLREKTEVRQ